MPKILTNLDLSGNQVLNFAMQNLAIAPANPTLGLVYYNTTLNRTFYYNGTQWIGMDAIDAAPKSFTNITDGTVTAQPDYANDILTFAQGGGLAVAINASTDTVIYSHADTSNATNIAPASRTYVTGLTFDTYGHVTGYTLGTETVISYQYTAGNGLSLVGTEFSHGDTSALSGLQGSNGISSITVDGMGHITGVTTASYSLSDHTHGQLHTQNTDTGTTSLTFQLNSAASGVRLKHNAENELAIRNSDDTEYANLRVNDLYVEGTQTIINSNIVNIGDNEIELNSDITLFSENSDGGLSVKRLAQDNTTRKDAKITYNNSLDRWTSTFGDASGDLLTATIANKIVATVGDGVSTSFVVTHNLGSRDLVVSLRDNVIPYETVMTDIKMTSENTITVKFALAPEVGRYNVTIIG